MLDRSQKLKDEVSAGESPDTLIPLLYHELRRLAAGCLRREQPGHTLQPTALVNEVWLRFAGQKSSQWKDRALFLAVAARVMRQVLVDHARTRKRIKRGAGQVVIRLEDVGELAGRKELDLESLDAALCDLKAIDQLQAHIVELRYFGGLSIAETAAAIGKSPATVKREWTLAKAWLHQQLNPAGPHES